MTPVNIVAIKIFWARGYPHQIDESVGLIKD
jgi:hypothetical protein